MKKKTVLRGIIGMPVGIFIGYMITMLVSLGCGRGEYLPCAPELAARMGSEMGAVLLQTLLCAVLGAAFGAGSMIWEIERWSIAGQTGAYLVVTSLAMLPTAYLLYWMRHSLAGFLSYLGIYLLVFLAIWLGNYFAVRRSIRKMNEKLK
mgnify:CR=1 FL=1